MLLSERFKKIALVFEIGSPLRSHFMNLYLIEKQKELLCTHSH